MISDPLRTARKRAGLLNLKEKMRVERRARVETKQTRRTQHLYHARETFTSMMTEMALLQMVSVETVSLVERMTVTEVVEKEEEEKGEERGVSNIQMLPAECGEERKRRSGYMICTMKMNRSQRKIGNVRGQEEKREAEVGEEETVVVVEEMAGRVMTDLAKTDLVMIDLVRTGLVTINLLKMENRNKNTGMDKSVKVGTDVQT